MASPTQWTCEVVQLCPTLCDPMDHSLPGFSLYGIFQARILEWVAISFSRRSSRRRDWTQVSRIVGRRFTVRATRKSPTDMSSGKLQELLMDREAWRAAVHGIPKSRTWLSDWTDNILFQKSNKGLSKFYRHKWNSILSEKINCWKF